MTDTDHGDDAIGEVQTSCPDRVPPTTEEDTIEAAMPPEIAGGTTTAATIPAVTNVTQLEKNEQKVEQLAGLPRRAPNKRVAWLKLLQALFAPGSPHG